MLTRNSWWVLRFIAILGLIAAGTLCLALDINLRGYTAGGKFLGAAPSPENSPTPQDNRAQLQAAIDAVAASGGGTVTIPGDSDPWFISRPVYLDKPNVTVTGENASGVPGDAGTKIDIIGTYNGSWDTIPPFLVGVPRQVTGVEITPSHRTDLYGTLDSSIHANTYFGLNTKGRNLANNADVYAHGYVSNTMLNVGPLTPAWPRKQTRWLCPYDNADPPTPRPDWYKFTFEVAIKQNTAGTLQGTICGVGMANDITNRFTYWMLGTFPNDADPTTVKFKFKTGNPDAGTYTVQSLPLAAITDTNVHRITVQLDMGSGQCAAWLDGNVGPTGAYSQLALGSVLNGDGTVNVNKQLWRYEQGAFQLGALHNGMLGDVTTDGLVSTQQHVDWTYCGFMMRSELRYAWATTLTRLDNGLSWPQPDWDNWRYFSEINSNLSAYLMLSDHPTAAADVALDGTLFTLKEGQDHGHTYGLWLPERGAVVDTDGQNGIRNLSLSDIFMLGPLTVGEVRNLTLDSMQPTGNGPFNYDDLNAGVMNGDDLPVITDTDCGRDWSDAAFAISAIYWANKEVHSTDYYDHPTPFTTIRLLGCRGSIRYLFLKVECGEYYLQSFAGARGGPLTIEMPCTDNEGANVPTKAGYYVEFSPLGHGVTRDTNCFTLRDTFTGVFPCTNPVVDIANVGEGTVDIANIFCQPAGSDFMQQIVRCANPNCYGSMENFIPFRQWSAANVFFDNCIMYPPNIYFNDADGYYYRAKAQHRPGASYVPSPEYPSVMITEDNVPHADELWKTYWTRQAGLPADWVTNTGYTAGAIVNCSTHILGYQYEPRAYKCLLSHTADATNQPGSGANWQTYWICLKWAPGIGYNLYDYVSADGAYYQCTQANTGSSANHPRPWDKLPVDSSWPFVWVNYTGPAGQCHLIDKHWDLGSVVPPVSGKWTTNGAIVYRMDPQSGQSTESRCTAGGTPGTWRNDNPLGPAQ